MAPSPRLIRSSYHEVLLRLSEPSVGDLLSLMFKRYPCHEWASFARFGWRIADNRLVITLACLDAPEPEDLDESVGHVAIQEPYTLRIALNSERHPLAVGIVHSHPEGARPAPSSIDDDMDGYYADYFASFAPGRPYVSLIVSQIRNKIAISGRIFFNAEWLSVSRVLSSHSGSSIEGWPSGNPPRVRGGNRDRVARLAAAFGTEAADRLRASSVAVIGAGGTGSAAIESLARAGVGRLIIVDPDVISVSNLERVHGSVPIHAESRASKVLVAANHVRSINPDCEIEAFVGALPQNEIIDAVVSADVALGCTDQQHSRLALSDLTVRYLVPSLDCGVALEGEDGRITGQIMQFVRFMPNDPCAICRGMIDPVRVTQELMSHDERMNRRASADKAKTEGREGAAYWRDIPQLNTVGYLTTAAGAMIAGYAIGWITGRFDPPFERLQLNWSAKLLDVTDVSIKRDSECSCGRVIGWADQAEIERYVSAPPHWAPPNRLQTGNSSFS